jgi:hypothetical protein
VNSLEMRCMTSSSGPPAFGAPSLTMPSAQPAAPTAAACRSRAPPARP